MAASHEGLSRQVVEGGVGNIGSWPYAISSNILTGDRPDRPLVPTPETWNVQAVIELLRTASPENINFLLKFFNALRTEFPTELLPEWYESNQVRDESKKTE